MGSTRKTDAPAAWEPRSISELCEPKRRPKVAALKRLFELWVLDRGFHDAFIDDPEAALAATGLDVDLRSATILLLGISKDPSPEEDLPEGLVWYQELFEGRYRNNIYARTRELSSEPRFRDWSLRQLRRCDRELGARGKLLLNVPLSFELTSGCSVGCPFCALAAGRLKGIFRYTDENSELWCDVLARMHRVVGDAASRALCYYATEPLDNPDYELFLKDFYDEFGRIPQTTTAAAARNLERTRELLRWGLETNPHFDRFSVLSKALLDELIAAFTPEELIFCDLLPQFEEAPGANFAKAGRNSAEGEPMEGTISCVNGFTINMFERSVRLMAPTSANAEHPTGEIVYEEATFIDGADLEKVVCDMIDRHMHETIGLADIFGALQ